MSKVILTEEGNNKDQKEMEKMEKQRKPTKQNKTENLAVRTDEQN